MLREHVDHRRIEMALGVDALITLGDDLNSPFVAVAGLVGTRRERRVVGIGDCDDTRRNRNLFAFYAVGVTAAVPFFMMKQGDLCGQ